MKIIYMEQTLNLMAQQDLEAVKKLMASGEVKQSNEVNYLVIK